MASTETPTATRSSLQATGSGRWADAAFRRGLALAGGAVLVILATMLISTSVDAWPVFRHEGLSFLTSSTWDPGTSRTEVTGEYGALPFVVGTLVTSLIALALAVPTSVGVSLYLTQVAPTRVRRPLSYTIELLAAVPSVVYGLWGLLFFVPTVLRPIMTFLSDTLGTFIPFLRGPVLTYNYFAAGVVLSIMVLPIITAVTREVMTGSPQSERFAAFGLGATRWEVMRHVVLPRARPGIVGASMLGLGRALGETIAVAMLIGGSQQVPSSIFQGGQSMAGIIAVTFQEATPENVRALIGVGVLLFLITIVVNGLARLVVYVTGGHVAGDAAV